MKKATTIISIILGLCTLAGVVIGFDHYFAKAEDLDCLAKKEKVTLIAKSLNRAIQRLDQKILQDKCDWMQNRIWKLEDRYLDKKMPPSVKEEYRKLILNRERLCRDLKPIR